jgi:metal-responsive CopG/Arc/MetJ family transcriptional regulator
MSTDKIVKIPDTLYKELENVHKQSIFPSLDDLIIFILQEYLDKQNASPEKNEKDAEKIIKERLKNLGYL